MEQLIDMCSVGSRLCKAGPSTNHYGSYQTVRSYIADTVHCRAEKFLACRQQSATNACDNQLRTGCSALVVYRMEPEQNGQHRSQVQCGTIQKVT